METDYKGVDYFLIDQFGNLEKSIQYEWQLGRPWIRLHPHAHRAECNANCRLVRNPNMEKENE